MAISRYRMLLLAACCAVASGCAPLQRADSLVRTLDRKITAACDGVEASVVEQASYDVPATAAESEADAEPLPAPALTTAQSPRAVATADLPVEEYPAMDAAPFTPADAPCGDVCCGDVCDGSCEGDASCCLLAAADECGRCSVCQHCRKLFSRPEPGPPPIRYRPALPPKFLPVPTQPTLSPARPDAPEQWRGDVEVGFRPQLTFPARD
jgi:hypothetical protein